MHRRIAIALLLAATLVAGASGPALAISTISNSLEVNSAGRYVSQGEKTYWTARSEYGQYLVKNPYTSDFECVVNARHFSAPRSHRTSGTSAYWRYTSYDAFSRGPAWRNYSGVLWVWQPRTVYNRFSAAGKSGTRRDWQRSGLGQHNWSVSRGTTDYQYTYHY